MPDDRPSVLLPRSAVISSLNTLHGVSYLHNAHVKLNTSLARTITERPSTAHSRNCLRWSSYVALISGFNDF